jgi:hypothetical protein
MKNLFDFLVVMPLAGVYLRRDGGQSKVNSMADHAKSAQPPEVDGG